MEEKIMFCKKCRKMLLQKNLHKEERDMGTYKLVFLWGECIVCGNKSNCVISRKKID